MFWPTLRHLNPGSAARRVALPYGQAPRPHRHVSGNLSVARHVLPAGQTREDPMKGIIAWLLGVPVVVIILFYFLDIF